MKKVIYFIVLIIILIISMYIILNNNEEKDNNSVNEIIIQESEVVDSWVNESGAGVTVTPAKIQRENDSIKPIQDEKNER